jgi:hypothetical protein
MQRKPSATSHRQQTIVIDYVELAFANIRFVPKLKSAKTLVKRHRKLPTNMLLTKSVIANICFVPQLKKNAKTLV